MKYVNVAALLITLFPSSMASLWAADAESPGNAAYLGSEVCKGCHQQAYETFSDTLMGKIFFNAPRTPEEARGCEACHGPASNHLAAVATGKKYKRIITFRDDSPQPVAERNAICLGCHESGLRMHWRGSQHEFADLACTNCHTILKRISPDKQLAKETEIETCFQCHTDRRAQLRRFSRHPMREGKVVCSDCHNPHGGPGRNLVKNTVNETCYQCHAEKRGPFLWEHQPVRESCTVCHDPHGTTQPRMLVQRSPFLCQNCHSTGHAAGIREAGQLAVPAQQFTAGKACLNCHSRIHGSNHPSGAKFTR